MIGEYQVQEQIGFGSSCQVYKAQRQGSLSCALKVMKTSKDSKLDRLLKNEVHCLEALSEHPNILQIIESSQALSLKNNEKVLFLATELAPNGEFFDLISG